MSGARGSYSLGRAAAARILGGNESAISGDETLTEPPKLHVTCEELCEEGWSVCGAPEGRRGDFEGREARRRCAAEDGQKGERIQASEARKRDVMSAREQSRAKRWSDRTM